MGDKMSGVLRGVILARETRTRKMDPSKETKFIQHENRQGRQKKTKRDENENKAQQVSTCVACFG